jgi:hypothetical protein
VARSKQYRHTFTVQGRFPFPIDMLRYDRCIPKSEGDSGNIAWSFSQGAVQTAVKVVHIGEKNWKPTTGRWESFLWLVIAIEKPEEV